jgi:mannose-6-phosphate isomerase-like protein (cupin superfamily)
MPENRLRIHNPIIKDTVTFIETCAESGGERTVLEIALAPGGGNPLHVHRSYDERFDVLDGRLGVQVRSDRRFLKPGDHAAVPRGTPHRFFSGDDEPCTFRVTLTPGHTGFEQSLCIDYGLAADGLTTQKSIPKSISHLAVTAVLSDTGLPGPGRLLNPLFRLLARRARARGIEDELLGRYAADLPR